MDSRRHTEDRPPLPGDGYLEDYTLPFMIWGGIVCFIILFAIWATWGMPFVLAFAWMADRLLRR